MKRHYIQTVEQEEKKIRTILARDFSASLLNNTKWRELITSLKELPVNYRIKFIDVEMPLDGYLSHRTNEFYDSNWGRVPILSVEWMEVCTFETRVRGLWVPPDYISHGPEIERRLTCLNIPYQLSDGYIRVTGHLRKGHAMPSNPSFKRDA